MKQSSCFNSSNNKDIKEPNTAKNIELLIQIMYNISIPSIIFEYISNKEANFEINDLKNFYTSFGEVIDFVIKDKKSIVLYKTFFAANACREFILNENNYKENMKNNFSVRWFDYEKDLSILPMEMQKLFKDIYNQNINNLKNNDINKNINKNKITNSNEYQINNINLDNNININNQNFINNNNININNNNIQSQFNIMDNQNSNINILSPNLINQYNQININQQQSLNNNLNNNVINSNILNNNIINNIINNNNINNNINNFQNLNLMNYISFLNELSNNITIPSQVNIPFFINNQNNNNSNNIGINNIKDEDLNINNINNNEYQDINNIQKQSYDNNNNNIEGKDYGRFTCKYQILLPNDKDFQIASRLIGYKGYNMKKIVNECKNNNNNKDSVKLRLRGRGSGYKEGLNNKESDEPLHLCISARNKEELNKACILVEDLLNKIYDDYKKYCTKNNIFPILKQLAIKIDCGYSLHKNK